MSGPLGISRRGWWRLLVVLAVVYSALHVGYSMVTYNPISSPYASGDFKRAYGEMMDWRSTGALDPKEVLHPPLYYVLLRPLALLDMATVVRILYVSQFLWYPLAVLLLVRIAAGGARPRASEYVLATVLLVNFQPFLETVAMHKVEGLEFVLLCLAIELFRRGRDALAGATVGLGANLKYLPVILGLYFLAKRERRVLAGMLAAGAVCAALSIAVMSRAGWAAALRYPLTLAFAHQHEGNRPEANMEFQTLSGAISRAMVGRDGMLEHFRTQQHVPIPHPALAFRLATGLKLGILLLYFYAMRRRWPAAARQTYWPVILCELSLTLLLTLVIAQASKVHYNILVLPAFISTALLLWRHPQVLGWPERLLFGVAYGLTAMVIPGGLLNRLPPHPVWGSFHSFAYLWFSLPFLGNLILAACLIRCRARLLRHLAGAPAHRVALAAAAEQVVA